jgi:hypothetical protein
MTAKQRVSAPPGRASRHLGYQRVGCDRISLLRASMKRKIASNSPGIRGMSAQTRQSPRRYPAPERLPNEITSRFIYDIPQFVDAIVAQT